MIIEKSKDAAALIALPQTAQYQSTAFPYHFAQVPATFCYALFRSTIFNNPFNSNCSVVGATWHFYYWNHSGNFTEGN